jgi:hypothetical protein
MISPRDAVSASEPSEAEIRADERRKVADLLAENAETLTGFAPPEKLVALIVFLLRLPGGSS